MTTQERYRFDSSVGSLYEYDDEAKAYLFVSKTQCNTKAEAIEEYEEYFFAQESLNIRI